MDSDGFHNSRDVRYRQGRTSARGYYEDAYNFTALKKCVLVPLGPDGSRVYATKVHDMGTDQSETFLATAPGDAIVIVDCTFLQRGSLRRHWDEVIYLQVTREVALARGVARDAAALGGIENARAAFSDRYMAACDIYNREEHPAQRASVVIDYDDLARPRAIHGLDPRARSRTTTVARPLLVDGRCLGAARCRAEGLAVAGQSWDGWAPRPDRFHRQDETSVRHAARCGPRSITRSMTSSRMLEAAMPDGTTHQ